MYEFIAYNTKPHMYSTMLVIWIRKHAVYLTAQSTTTRQMKIHVLININKIIISALY